MNLELRRVTRLSQIIAIVLFVSVFALGFWLGTRYERAAYENAFEAVLLESAASGEAF
ncbi:MAG TPA: hypothetical protein VFY28_00970 [Candidatus Paceibacterota bacterium]|nr:hypothetical protein [Candidatus Paceibacterota bacterium]